MRKAPQALVRNNWQPFYLTSVYPSSAEPDVTQSLSISDIISSFNPSSTSSSSNSNNHNDVNYVCLINYMVDPDWLFTACPLLQSVPVLLLHGHRGMEIGPRSNVISSIVDMGEERYGTHHSKMMIVFYNSGVRIAIGTANLIEVDWTIKTQGFYVQDFPLKNTTQTASSSSSSSSQINSAPASIPNTLKAESENDFSFEKDLIGYLRCVRLLSPIAQRMLAERVIARLSLYDYHTAEVVLIPSVPGRHAVSRPLEGINRWGHMKLRDSLLHHKFFVGSQGRQNKITQSTNPNPNPSSLSSINRVSTGTKNSCGEESRNDESVLVMQASSISTMGKNDGFASELAASMDSTGPNTKIRLLWPTVKTVRQSLGGYQSGTSLPCSSKVIISHTVN